MAIEERRVAVGDLKVGMYVCRLEREGDWAGTPFLLQGSAIESEDDIDALRPWATHVYVDILAGLAPDESRIAPLPRPAPVRKSYDAREIDGLRNRHAYANTSSFEEELPRAREASEHAGRFANRMLDDVRAGRHVSPEEVREAVEPMVRSMLRNVDTFLWLESLRKRDAYAYTHALNCSALAAVYGRHTGFPEDLLVDLAAGGLMLDIGKLRLREGLLEREGPLDDGEMAEVRQHVELGLDMVVVDGVPLPRHVYEMIDSHHERHDGGGYPHGWAGNAIPLLGRIAGIVDTYDALTSERPHRAAVPQHEALQVLYRERDRAFAAEVVEQFLQCLGVYPTGSLVELSTGEVAVVVAQNVARRLRPRVMVLTTADKRELQQFWPLDLMAQDDRARGVNIAQSLPPGSHGLDPADLFL